MDAETLIDRLSDRPEAYPHPVEALAVHETHISWVVTTGRYAYKIKKPVRLPFVDFSTLERRELYCREELRLNRRTAPSLYLDVVPVTGTANAPVVDGSGEPIEFALKMVQFDDAARLDLAVDAELVSAEQLAEFGVSLASFQDKIDREKSAAYGDPDAVEKRLRRNAAELADVIPDDEAARLDGVSNWLGRRARSLSPLLAARAEGGYTREGHGDMHLGNLVLLDGEVVAFDCIEFDEALRWTDVIDEAAFTVMDLESRKRPDLAAAFLDAYLQATGDYEGMQLMPLYSAHRALVRAKVACLTDGAGDAAPRHSPQASRLLRYAEGLQSPGRPMLILMHGLPASGKSRIASSLVAALPGIRVSSDVERKRAAGLGRHTRTGSGTGSGLYSAANTKATYARLREIAGTLLRAGRHAIVDATFASAEERAAFIALAREIDADATVVHCGAPMAELERRIEERSRREADSEADLTVLHYASDRFEPADESEGVPVLDVDTVAGIEPEALVKALRERGGSAS